MVISTQGGEAKVESIATDVMKLERDMYTQQGQHIDRYYCISLSLSLSLSSVSILITNLGSFLLFRDLQLCLSRASQTEEAEDVNNSKRGSPSIGT